MASVAAPAKTLQSAEGYFLAKVCNEDGCVLTQVNVVLRVDADDTWIACYHDPLDPMRNAAAGGTDSEGARSLGQMLAAIASLAPVQP